jgi:hypothetical protein
MRKSHPIWVAFFYRRDDLAKSDFQNIALLVSFIPIFAKVNKNIHGHLYHYCDNCLDFLSCIHG